MSISGISSSSSGINFYQTEAEKKAQQEAAAKSGEQEQYVSPGKALLNANSRALNIIRQMKEDGIKVNSGAISEKLGELEQEFAEQVKRELKDRGIADDVVQAHRVALAAADRQQPRLLAGDRRAAGWLLACLLLGLTIGSRVTFPTMPAWIPSGLICIVEGFTESIESDAWTLTINLSPDVYSRLFILDDPVQGVLDGTYLLGP